MATLEAYLPDGGGSLLRFAVPGDDGLLAAWPSAAHSHSAPRPRAAAGPSSGATAPALPAPAPLLQASLRAQAAADDCVALVDALDERYRQVTAVTSVLHAEFKRLVEDEARSRSVVERIYRPLAFFESLFVVGRRLGVAFDAAELAEVAAVMREASRFASRAAPTQEQQQQHSSSPPQLGEASVAGNPHRVRPIELPLTPEDDEFPLALERLDECIAYLAGHAQFRDATAVLLRLKHVQEHALVLVKGAVQESVERVADAAARELERATAAAAEAARAGRHAPLPDAAEMTHLHLRFRTDLAHVRRLVHMVEVRVHKRACAEILDECYRAYLGCRLRLVSRVARAKLQRAADERSRPLRQRPTAAVAVPSPPPVAASSPAPAASRRPPATPAALSALSDAGPAPRSGASAYTAHTAATARTAATRATSLWSEAVTSREACVVDAARTCAAIMARISQAEHALFHSLFTAPLPGALTGGEAAGALDLAAHATHASPLGRAMSSAASVASGRSRATTTRFGTPASQLHQLQLQAQQQQPQQPSHVRAAADAALGAMQEELCAVLVDVLRPLLLQVDSLDVLADVVHVLRDEVLGELAAPRGPALAPLARVVAALVCDVQERIVFRAGRFVGERIGGFAPSAAAVTYPLQLPLSTASGTPAVAVAVTVRGDGDFLGRMLAFALRTQQAAALAQLGDEAAPVSFGEVAAARRAALEALPPPTVYESWHPVLETTLVLLATLYRCVDRPSFESLAQDAVAACTAVLLREGAAIEASATAVTTQAAARGLASDAFFADRVSFEAPPARDASQAAVWTRGLAAGTLRLGALAPRSMGAEPAPPPLDGALFLIKTLLVLREQLSPFDIALTSTTRALDFTATTEALGQLLGSLGGVLRFSRDNPLLSFVAEALPTVHERTTDFKLRLETLLKSSCEALILVAHTLLAGGLEAFLEAHAPAHAHTHAHGTTPAEGSKAAEAGEAAAAAFEAAALRALDEAQATLLAELPALRRRLGLYLGFQVTAAILFKPVREQLLAALQRVRRAVAESGCGAAAALVARVQRLVAVVEASDRLVTDPFSAAFGCDDALLAEAVAGL